MSSNSNDPNKPKWKRGTNLQLNNSMFEESGPLRGPVQHKAGLSPPRRYAMGAPSLNILRRPNGKPFFALNEPSALEKTYSSMAPGMHRNWIKSQLDRERNARAAARANALRRASKKQNRQPSTTTKENTRNLRDEFLRMGIGENSSVAGSSPVRNTRKRNKVNSSNRSPARNGPMNTSRRGISEKNLRVRPGGRMNFFKSLQALGLNEA